MNRGWRFKLHEIIYEADTPAGKVFDVALLWSIVLSVAAVLLESVESLRQPYGELFDAVEWFFTILFSIEYLLRLITVRHPSRYAFSFFGMVDFLAIMPTYLQLLVEGPEFLLVIRAIRLLRVFRIFKLARYVTASRVLLEALRASRPKIVVFLTAVLTLAMVMGSLMYAIEGAESGFSSIPRSIYWAIVTLTTVGYGDITPVTVAGQVLASLLMIMGFGIIAVPTGIVSVELAQASKNLNTQACLECNFERHDDDARFCKRCGESLGS